MNWTQIYNRALRQTHTNAVDYNTTQADDDIDLRYQEIVDEIVSVTKWDYFWDKWVTNTVVWQSEYVAEKLGISPDDLDIKKINKVFVKYKSTQEDFTKVLYQNPWALPEHPNYYKDNQSTAEPFFYIQDTSIFLYPAPTEVIVWGLELFVTHKPVAITTSSAENVIEIPTQFHKLISDWLRIDIFLSQGKENEAQLAQQKYDTWLRDMVAIMKQRYNATIIKSFVNNLNPYR